MKPVLPPQWQWVRLGAVLERKRELINPSDHPDREFNSVGLEDIGSDGTGDISFKTVTGAELVSAKAMFKQGDLLYGRLRPYLNKVAIAPCQGVSSTEIWVLSPCPFLENEFTFWMLTSRYMLRHLERVTEGANLPRVDADGFDRIEIPIPPLSEQRRIVEILNEARDIRRLRQQADDLTTQLIPAIFNEMFGDPLLNPKGWPTAQLSHSYKIRPNYGTMTPAGDSEDGVLCIRVGDIQQNQLNLGDASRVPRESIDNKRHLVETGDIVLVRAIGSLDHLGKSVVIEPEENGVAFDSHLMRVRFDQSKLLPHFVHSLFLTPGGRRSFLKNTRQSAVQVNINTDEYGRIRIPMPPLGLQKNFVERVTDIRMLGRQQESARTLELRTHQSLLAYAFSGELTADWRDQNREQLTREAIERDHWLKENGVKLAAVDHHVARSTNETEGRHWELSREQRKLLEQIQQLDRNDNGGVFTLSSLKLTEPLDKLPTDSVRRHLDVLAARGLIKAVSRRAGAGGSANVGFGNVYRLPLREEDIVGTGDDSDFARLSELDRFSKQGRAISVSINDRLELSDSVEGAVDSIQGDD